MKQEVFKNGDILIPRPNRKVSNGYSLQNVDNVLVTTSYYNKYAMICTIYYKNTDYSTENNILYKEAFMKKIVDEYEIY